MKKSAVFVALIGTMMLMGGLPSFAQTAYNFHAPATFYAGNAKMPAGTYTIRQSQDDPQMYELQNSSGSHSVILETRPSSKGRRGSRKSSSINMERWTIWRGLRPPVAIRSTYKSVLQRRWLPRRVARHRIPFRLLNSDPRSRYAAAARAEVCSSA